MALGKLFLTVYTVKRLRGNLDDNLKFLLQNFYQTRKF